MSRWSALITLLVVASGCSTNSTPSPGPDANDVTDVVDVLTIVDIVFSLDSVEVHGKDATEPGDPDIEIVADAFVPTPECEAGEGCFLDPCSSNSECQSGWCVEHLGEGVCTQACLEECPDGWSCQQVSATGPDIVYICVSDFANLCKPCANGNDCDAIGIADGCLEYGAVGSFCGGECSDPEGEEPIACPWGFVCQERTDTDGLTSWQCVAEAGSCPCTKKSIALELHTPCSVTNEFGTCQGLRLCEEQGLSACDASMPALETCNGIDDNCNGVVDEATCDDGNECTQDSCDPDNGCQHEALDVGECKDGDPCTAADHCVAGLCVGSLVSCDDGNACTDDICTEAGCLHEPNQDDCDDSDPCTVGDVCKQGACVGAAVDCDCVTDGDCAVLEDGDVCNGTLVCNTSKVPHQCVVEAATVVSCPEPQGPDAQCLDAVCDPDTGACSLAPANEGQACDDGDPCTVSETCTKGVCAQGIALNCNDGNPCTDDLCHPKNGCQHAPNAAGCDDGDDCTLGDVCLDGECQPGSALNCDDDNDCTDDSCEPGIGCVFAPNAAGCSDANPCTSGDHCSAGKCVALGALDCNDANPCTDDSCSPAVGCTHQLNTAPCDDGNACTSGDKCANGWCSGAFLNCNDKNPCTDDACDPDSGCTHTPAEGVCSDGSLCTTGDHCVDGECVGAQEVQCHDDNPCTDDECIDALGCVFKLNAAPCDDGDPCTVGDHCNAGNCAGGNALDCDDAVACTVDSCVADAGCLFTPDHAACNDDNPCTDDICDPDNGCIHNLNASPCQDGDPCTIGDTCDLGSCQSGEFTDCSDGNACTTDGCDPELGCTHTPTAGNCDDGDACTNADHCEVGECVGGPVLTCVDAHDCTIDSCDPESGCLFTEDHDFCDDDNPCTKDLCSGQTGCSNTPHDGDCPGGHCENGECIVDCLPQCDGKTCGDDGCSGSCGFCGAGLQCMAGKCVEPGSDLCDDGNDILWDGCTNNTISEFRVNTFTPGQQANPRVAAFSDNGYVVVWGSYDQDGSTWGVYGQRYQADGSADGEEFQVNTYSNGQQSTPVVEVDADDNFVVAWQSDSQDGSGYGVYARKFDRTGEPLWGEVQLNNTTGNDQFQVSLAANAGGGFVAAWQHYHDGSNYGIRARRFNADGTPIGSDFQANSYYSNQQERVALAPLTDGGFVAIWDSNGQDGSGWSVYGQRFLVDGSKTGGEFKVNTYTPSTQYMCDVASAANGSFVATWGSDNEDGNNYGVYAQRFKADGSKNGNPFRVNTYIVSTQYEPAIGAHADGRFAIAWQSIQQDGADWGVYLQRYNADGTPAGNETQVNVFASYSQHQPDVAMLPNGTTVVVWTGNAQDDSVSGVFAQRFDASGHKLYH
jgi:hypothetical protein